MVRPNPNSGVETPKTEFSPTSSQREGSPKSSQPEVSPQSSQPEVSPKSAYGPALAPSGSERRTTWFCIEVKQNYECRLWPTTCCAQALHWVPSLVPRSSASDAPTVTPNAGRPLWRALLGCIRYFFCIVRSHLSRMLWPAISVNEVPPLLEPNLTTLTIWAGDVDWTWVVWSFVANWNTPCFFWARGLLAQLELLLAQLE